MKEIPASVYDYLLFYECSATDWLPGKNSQKINIAKNSPGTLVNNINWSVGGTTVPGDKGGNTKCGITWKTWDGFYKKHAKKYGLTCGANVNNMDKKGWLSFIDYKWPKAANTACALIYFQWLWGSGSCKSEQLVTELRNRADKLGWVPRSGGTIGEKVLDATFGFKNPMDAYQIIRDFRIQYLWNISAKPNENSQFRTGWLRRCIGSFQDDGLYLAEANQLYNIPYDTPIKDRKAICNQLKGKGNYVLLCKWDDMPTNPDAFNDFDLSSLDEGGSSGGSPTGERYSPKFSTGVRDKRLANSKPKEPRKGMLLGSEFKIK